KAFLPENHGILKEERFIEIDIEKLKPSPIQPRLKFDEDSIDGLAKSIKERGILQPIVAVPEDGYFKIIIGERRWRAAQKIGLKKIPTLIRSMTNEQQLEASLIENLQREDLNPLEIALAYKKMTEELKYTQQEISEKVGKDRASVANYIRLLKLPQQIKDMIADNKLSMSHARTLITIDNQEMQVYIARQIVKKDLSVRDTEKMSRRLKQKVPEKEKMRLDPNLLLIQEELLKKLGMKVSISGNQDKGIVKIFYFSVDDLNKIYEKIKGDN
ncbi:MAG: ParB/RepB/Spo0J family partition protein, partial [Acidobacteriota bacterium]|nr:ParB/RepB/Spo0J family partition protein [Acidobacteriota bacterium]